jgi:hypothetical protein
MPPLASSETCIKIAKALRDFNGKDTRAMAGVNGAVEAGGGGYFVGLLSILHFGNAFSSSAI